MPKGIHRVTTNDKDEAIETGKIYLGTEFYRNIAQINPKRYKKCKNCGVVLRFNRKKNNSVNYCLECSPKNKYAGIYKKTR